MWIRKEERVTTEITVRNFGLVGFRYTDTMELRTVQVRMNGMGNERRVVNCIHVK